MDSNTLGIRENDNVNCKDTAGLDISPMVSGIELNTFINWQTRLQNVISRKRFYAVGRLQ